MAGARARPVLIVEDDKTTGDLLATAINDQRGYTALTVGNGHDALDALGRVDPDLLLLDIRMPGMSGLDLYDRVRADPRFRSLPIVFETGRVASMPPSSGPAASPPTSRSRSTSTSSCDS